MNVILSNSLPTILGATAEQVDYIPVFADHFHDFHFEDQVGQLLVTMPLLEHLHRGDGPFVGVAIYSISLSLEHLTEGAFAEGLTQAQFGSGKFPPWIERNFVLGWIGQLRRQPASVVAVSFDVRVIYLDQGRQRNV